MAGAIVLVTYPQEFAGNIFQAAADRGTFILLHAKVLSDDEKAQKKNISGLCEIDAITPFMIGIGGEQYLYK